MEAGRGRRSVWCQRNVGLVFVCGAGADTCKSLATDSCLSMLVSVISERHINLLTSWPAPAGGGPVGAAATCLAAVDLIQVCVSVCGGGAGRGGAWRRFDSACRRQGQEEMV